MVVVAVAVAVVLVVMMMGGFVIGSVSFGTGMHAVLNDNGLHANETWCMSAKSGPAHAGLEWETAVSRASCHHNEGRLEDGDGGQLP